VIPFVGGAPLRAPRCVEPEPSAHLLRALRAPWAATLGALHDVPAAPPGQAARTGPPSALARNAVIGVLVTLVAAANLGNVLFASLVNEHPLALIAMNPSNRNLALASANLDPLAFYGVGFLRLLAPDPLFFLLGRWYGDAAIRWMERKAPSYGELLRQLEHWFGRARYLVVAIAPNNPICLFAGAAGMGVVGFAIANVVGTAVRLLLIRAFSAAFEDLLGPVRDFIGEYRWPITALSVVLVAFTIWNDRRGGRDGIGDLVNLEEGIADAEAELAAEATMDADDAEEAR
jgi:membrane protein DedA with SNARE-associated domain